MKVLRIGVIGAVLVMLGIVSIFAGTVYFIKILKETQVDLSTCMSEKGYAGCLETANKMLDKLITASIAFLISLVVACALFMISDTVYRITRHQTYYLKRHNK